MLWKICVNGNKVGLTLRASMVTNSTSDKFTSSAILVSRRESQHCDHTLPPNRQLVALEMQSQNAQCGWSTTQPKKTKTAHVDTHGHTTVATFAASSRRNYARERKRSFNKVTCQNVGMILKWSSFWNSYELNEIDLLWLINTHTHSHASK